jgi:hypothetical protein
MTQYVPLSEGEKKAWESIRKAAAVLLRSARATGEDSVLVDDGQVKLLINK